MINSNDLDKIISDLKEMKTNINTLQKKYEELKGGLNSKQHRLELLTKEKKLLDEILLDFPQYKQDMSKINELQSTYKTAIDSLDSEIQSTDKDYFDRIKQLYGVKHIVEGMTSSIDYERSERDNRFKQLKNVRNSFIEYILFCWRTDKNCFPK